MVHPSGIDQRRELHPLSFTLIRAYYVNIINSVDIDHTLYEPSMDEPSIVSSVLLLHCIVGSSTPFIMLLSSNLLYWISAVGVCASAYTLAVIAVERYYAICRPLQSRKWKTKKRALLTISMVWIFSFACNFGTLFIFDSVRYRTQWTCDTYGGPLVNLLYQLYVTLVLLFIPLCVMVSLYGHVIYSLSTAIVGDNPVEQRQSFQKTGMLGFSEAINRSENHKLVGDLAGMVKTLFVLFFWCHGMESNPRRASRSPNPLSLILLSYNYTPIFEILLFAYSFFAVDALSEYLSIVRFSLSFRFRFQEKILMAKKKVTRMLMTIVVAFAVCWLPNFLWWLLVRASDFAGAPVWHSGLNMALTALTYISSTTNPITYCFMNKGFRSSVLVLSRSQKSHRVLAFSKVTEHLRILVKTVYFHNFGTKPPPSLQTLP
uniref:G_PROTEIN_RECEP_F1_2 domain-containing protein n=1 Tax=Angiostrongylus cantonensis TaxID=6313 RepID=A0A0K0CVR4_ANGCA